MHVLRAKFSSDVHKKRKDKIWQEITDKVYSQGNMREVVEVLKKWQNVQCKKVKEVRDYGKECRKTGTKAL